VRQRRLWDWGVLQHAEAVHLVEQRIAQRNLSYVSLMKWMFGMDRLFRRATSRPGALSISRGN